jgi:hypothetical protein
MSENQQSQRGTISLTQLMMSDEFQVRRKLDQATIARYENVLRSGATLPPVKVAKVDGIFILVDGFHRVAARERLEEATVEAEVIETTRTEAYWLAASANLQHGLPLKPAEIHEVFKAYIKARKHLKGRGQPKTYREIGAEIGKPHTTIRNWMKKDYPEIFKRYSGDENFAGDGGLPEMEAAASPAVEAGMAKIAEFREIYRATVSAEARRELAEAFTETARELLGDGWQEYQGDF